MSHDYFVFIPAGSDYEINGKFKHHLELGEKSILENIIDKSLKAGFKVITTIRESDELKEKYKNNSNVVVLESKEKLTDSCISGLMEGIINNFYDCKFRGIPTSLKQVKKHFRKYKELENMRIIYLGSDAPFITSTDIQQFLLNYKESNSDIFIGMTKMEKVSDMDNELNLGLDKIDSTLSNYCVTDKGNLRISNMYVMNPSKIILSGLQSIIQVFYDNRKLSKENRQLNLTSLAGDISGIAKFVGRAIMYLPTTMEVTDQAKSLKKHIRGKNHDYVVNADDALKNASKISGLKIDADYSCSAAPLLDIDDKATYNVFRKHYSSILNYFSNKI